MKIFKTPVRKLLEACGYTLRRAEFMDQGAFDLASVSRLLYFKRLFDRIRNVPGDIVECGVGRGDSLLMLALLAKDEGAERKLWGFDSFEGLPEPSDADHSPRRPKRGQIAWSIYSVQKRLLDSGLPADFFYSQITLVKGLFQDTLKEYRGESIALLHADVDLYESYLTVLESLYPKVTPGGVVAFDEYLNTFELLHWPGARKAIDEYFAGRPEQIMRDERSGKYFLSKAEPGGTNATMQGAVVRTSNY